MMNERDSYNAATTQYKEKKTVDIYDIDEVRKLCDFFNCTPYMLFIAYKAVGQSFDNIKNYIESKFSVNEK